ncbi:hypothetical protein TSUD_255430 [Trifolium subterraneum]|uniref:histidine kinase n=2 Tax=Trifolium TaxID=3898 RepID=A0A2Z6NXS6_TRISU|nr:hypothetical protein TSUD_255430 [Trifolium subterraneum]
MLLSSGIINTPPQSMCLKNQEFQKEHRYVAESIEQCPILDDFVHTRLGLSFPWKTYVTLDSALLTNWFNVLLCGKSQKQKVFKKLPAAQQKRIQHSMHDIAQRRVEMLSTMCDERARMLQDQFNVSMNHVHALAILVSTFHHGKHPSAVDQNIFGKYTESSAFERPLTSGVAYALKVLHSDRVHFEKQHGWTIKNMEAENEALVQDCIPENLDPAPIQDEYAPVIFAQETVSHIVSIDMMSGKEDRENILRARASGKGVLTSPFKLLKSNHLGVVLTFAVYNSELPPNATPDQRIEATAGYLGASYDVPSLVDKLLHQLASKQTIVVNVYDTTNASAPITMYGTDVIDTGLLHISGLDFGDPLRKHEMHCRTPMNGVLGMLQMLMDTDLDDSQMDFAQTAHTSGKDLISVINEVLYQAKIEAGKLELEAVAFHPQAILDEVLSLFSEKANEKGIELAVYVSNQVPQVVIGDPKRFRQIIANLVGNSLKFTHDKGHVFVSIHLAKEVKNPHDITDAVLREGLMNQDISERACNNTLSGFPVVNRWKSWENFKKLYLMDESETIQLLVTVEDTGIGIPTDAQSRIFTPFMQADSSTSRTYGGTGIGLSISKCLVDLMGGEIGFVSEPKIGSTFSFTGNFRKGETKSLDEKWQQKYNPFVSEFRGLKALVIDRRKIRAEVTRYHLQRLGMSVDVNSSLQSACFCLSDTCNSSMSRQLAMILIDKDSSDNESSILYAIKKQRQNGIKEDTLNFPKIFLLATDLSHSERNELKSAGIIDDILMKPLWLSVLIQYYREKVFKLGNLLIQKRILVVDDNAVNRKVAEGVLRKYGAVVTCVDGATTTADVTRPSTEEFSTTDQQNGSPLWPYVDMDGAKMNAEFELWCVADEQTTDSDLQDALNWACGKGGADCSKIQQDQPCYFPNTLKDHASYAFNSYFQKFKNKGGSCYFRGAAITTEVMVLVTMTSFHDGNYY